MDNIFLIREQLCCIIPKQVAARQCMIDAMQVILVETFQPAITNRLRQFVEWTFSRTFPEGINAKQSHQPLIQENLSLNLCCFGPLDFRFAIRNALRF